MFMNLKCLLFILMICFTYLFLQRGMTGPDLSFHPTGCDRGDQGGPRLREGQGGRAGG